MLNWFQSNNAVSHNPLALWFLWQPNWQSFGTTSINILVPSLNTLKMVQVIIIFFFTKLFQKMWWKPQKLIPFENIIKRRFSDVYRVNLKPSWHFMRHCEVTQKKLRPRFSSCYQSLKKNVLYTIHRCSVE